MDDVAAWFAGRLPDGWFVEAPDVRADREEILVVGELATPELGEGATEESRQVAGLARIGAFRDDTRAARMGIADDAELLWGRKVSWGARCCGAEQHFTTQSVPVMTRLRMDERAVLDTLIDAGVARSRSEALAWCVRLVGRNQAEWIGQLREAMSKVQQVRDDGPSL
jgi:hypothetical protein